MATKTDFPKNASLAISELYKQKSDIKDDTLYNLGLKCGIQKAINLFHKIYANELEVKNEKDI